jgi:hypothetical protein
LSQLEAYFFSSGFDSLGEAGVVGVVGDMLELELDEPAIPLPVVVEPVAPVPDVEVSAPGAGVGDGAVVVVEGEDAGGGVVTVLSSFLLHAVRPIATRATTRSERFMFFSFREDITRVGT